MYKKGNKGYQRKLTPLQKKQVKQLISKEEELKAKDSSVLSSVDAGGVISKFLVPPQGDGVSDRNGDAIKLKRLRVRLHLIGADSTNVIRAIIFRWNNNDGTTVPVIGDVLQTLSTASQYQYTSDRQNEFHIVADKTFTFSLNGTNAKDWIIAYYGRKLGKKSLTFNAALTTGTDMLYLLLLSDSVAAPHPTVGGTCRLEYTDS